MDSVALALQLLLAVVFATAGIGKLLDLPGSRQALSDFGVPERATPVAGLLLPLAELGTAVALVVQPSARWGAIAAAALLLAFIGGIANALSRGQAPDCHCFGQIHSAPAGRGTLVRNGGLAILAGFVAVHGPGVPIDDWVTDRGATEVIAVVSSIAAAGLAALALALWLDRRTLRSALDAAEKTILTLPPGLPVGAMAPSFALPSVQGEPLTLQSLCARGRPVALIFMSPGCGGCETLMPDVGRWQATLSERLTIVIVSSGSPEDNRPAMQEHGITDVMLQQFSEVMNDYRLRATPAAVVVATDGTIASAPAEGGIEIEPLVRLAVRRAGTASVVGPAAA